MKCADDAQFYREYARKLAGELFVGMPEPLAPGASFPLHIKFSDGAVHVRGTAQVVKVVEKPSRGVCARFITLDPDSLQFALAFASLEDTDRPLSGDFLRPSFTGEFPSLKVAPAEPSSETPPQARPTPPTAAPLAVLATLAAHAPKPEPAPVPPPSKRPLVLAAVFGLLLAVGLGNYAWTAMRAGGLALEERVAKFDERFAAGQLAGPGGDSALDQLVAARALDPADARVKARSAQLVQVFALLAQKAIDRGDDAEAAVHLQAQLLSDPNQPDVAQKLKAAEDRVKNRVRAH